MVQKIHRWPIPLFLSVKKKRSLFYIRPLAARLNAGLERCGIHTLLSFFLVSHAPLFGVSRVSNVSE